MSAITDRTGGVLAQVSASILWKYAATGGILCPAAQRSGHLLQNGANCRKPEFPHVPQCTWNIHNRATILTPNLLPNLHSRTPGMGLIAPSSFATLPRLDGGIDAACTYRLHQVLTNKTSTRLGSPFGRLSRSATRPPARADTYTLGDKLP